MRRLLALLALWACPAQGAGLSPAVPAVAAAPRLFAPAPLPWVSAFSGLSRWLRTDEGRREIARRPYLAHLTNLHPDALGVAVAPLASRLGPDDLEGLSALPRAEATERERVLESLARVREEAAGEVEARASDEMSRLSFGEHGVEELRDLLEQLRGLSFFSRSLRKDYRGVRRMLTERLMRRAEGEAARLIPGLDWDSGDFGPADPGDAALPPSGPQVAHEAPSSFYSPRHWSAEIVPDRGYARRLAAAARLFEEADRAAEAGHEPRRRAQEALLDRLREADSRVHSHALRVGLMAGLIAWRMGFSMDFAQRVAWGARAHDLGKQEPEVLALVRKSGKLTEDERRVMELHPELGARLIREAHDLDVMSRRVGARTALGHHETMDGLGYPGRLAGYEIPVAARITSVADFFDALLENRPYRRGMTEAEALEVMEAVRVKFDPAAWQAFLSIVAPARAGGESVVALPQAAPSPEAGAPVRPTRWQRLQNIFIFQPPRGGGLEALSDDAIRGSPIEEAVRLVRGRVREARFRTADGLTLYGWRLDAEPGRPTVVYAHANAEHTGHAATAYLMSLFAAKGYGFFTFDYRGYGNSEGEPSERGVSLDLKAAVRHLQGQGVPAADQVLLGRSLGAAVAVDVARQGGFRALVLMSPFTSMRAAVAELKRLFRVPRWLPIERLFTQRFDSLAKIGSLDLPLLVFHGDRDELLPPSMGRALYDAAPAGRKAFMGIEGGDHNGLFYRHGQFVSDGIDGFLKGR